jgi:uncharacterized protein
MTFEGGLRHGCAVLWVTLALCLPFVASAQLAVPPLLGHVTDQTGTLSKEQQSSLEQTLVAFEARKGSQLAVLIVPTTAPEEIEQYSLRVAEQWKLGRKKVDDGAILVVAKNDRAVRIEVGYGLEGALSDIVSKRIISEAIVPRFRQSDYAGGIVAGMEQIIRVVDGEPLPASHRSTAEEFRSIRDFAPFLFIVALAVGGILRAIFGKVPGALITGVVVTALAWFVIGTLFLAALAGLAAMVVTLIGGGRVLHGIGGLTRGGGLGGGGLRGGGGGFGGGGASGRW